MGKCCYCGFGIPENITPVVMGDGVAHPSCAYHGKSALEVDVEAEHPAIEVAEQLLDELIDAAMDAACYERSPQETKDAEKSLIDVKERVISLIKDLLV